MTVALIALIAILGYAIKKAIDKTDLNTPQDFDAW